MIIGAAEFSQQGEEIFSNTKKRRQMMLVCTFYLWYPIQIFNDLFHTKGSRTSNNFVQIFGGVKRRKKMVMSGGNSVIQWATKHKLYNKKA
jgi:hypothetical protein